jgi:hypothetical protein
MKELAGKVNLKELADKAKDVATSAAVIVGDLNGDGVVDEEDARIAAEWTKTKASSIGNEAARLGKEAMRSDLAKEAASYAAIGAAVAVPVPVVGPLAGAAVGAGLGAYKSFMKKESGPSASSKALPAPVDVHAELLKLHDLHQKGVITDAEFDNQKRKLFDKD